MRERSSSFDSSFSKENLSLSHVEKSPYSHHSHPSQDLDLTRKEGKGFKWGKWVFCCFFFAYTIAAIVLSSQRGEYNKAVPIVAIFCIYFIRRIFITFRHQIKNAIVKPYRKLHLKFETPKSRKVTFCVIFAIFLIAIIAIVISVAAKLDDYSRLIGFAGLIILYAIGWLASKHKRSIKMRPILGALMYQTVMGLFVMRTSIGFHIVKWMSDILGSFLGFIMAGSQFVFGSDMVMINPSFSPVEAADGSQVWGIEGAATADGTLSLPVTTPANTLSYFGFVVIPTVCYFGAFASIMYHAQLFQPMIKGVGYSFGFVLGTTIPESVNAAASMMLGLSEAPLLIRPFLTDMTTSEIHAIMVAGLATVSGSVMSAYLALGVPANILISSAAMSSVGSLGLAKLVWPETEKEEGSKKNVDSDKLNNTLYGHSQHSNIVEAAAAGASDCISLALNIGAMLIAFLSIIAAFNALLNSLCLLVDVHGPNGDPVTIELILGFIFSPIVYCMGVTIWSEALIVGQFVGLKLMANEMTAYVVLSEYLSMNDICNAGLPTCDLTKTLSDRAVLISSYALCGFGNFGSIGILVGGLTPMAPEKRTAITTSVSRALVAGTLTNMIVATIAGIIEDPSIHL